MQGGPKHGPYYARYWWQDGRRFKRYVRQDDGVHAAAACAERRAADRDARAQAASLREAWRDMRTMIREVEHG